jgi:hypothetical protein
MVWPWLHQTTQISRADRSCADQGCRGCATGAVPGAGGACFRAVPWGGPAGESFHGHVRGDMCAGLIARTPATVVAKISVSVAGRSRRERAPRRGRGSMENRFVPAGVVHTGRHVKRRFARATSTVDKASPCRSVDHARHGNAFGLLEGSYGDRHGR